MKTRSVAVVVVVLLLLGSFFSSTAFALTNQNDEIKPYDDIEVRDIQAALIGLNYNITDPENEFGKSTRNALFMFQDDNGLNASGEFDEATYAKLFIPEEKEIPTVAEYRRDEPYPDEVSGYKAYLYLLGYECTDTTSVIDDHFTLIIRQFQKDSGLEETGICDYKTREEIERAIQVPHLFPVLRENEEGSLLFGLIDKNGNNVVPAIYKDVYFSEGVYRMDTETERHFYTYSGSRIKTEFNTTGYFYDGFLEVNEKDSLSLVNPMGQLCFPFLSGYYFRDDFGPNFWQIITNKKTHKDGIIDVSGNWLLDCTQDKYYVGLGEGWYDIKGDKFVNAYDPSLVIDYNDNPDKMAVAKFSDGMLYVRYSNDQTYIYNTKGEIAFPIIWDSMGGFNNGLAPVKQDGLWGFINTSGEIVIDIQYKDISTFAEGYASVQYPGSDKYTVIDRTGNNPLPNIWSEEKIVFQNGIGRIIQNGKVGYTDLNGEIIIPCEWDNPERTHGFNKNGDLILVGRNEKCYYLNRQGEIVTTAGPIEFESKEPEKAPEKAPNIVGANEFSESYCKDLAIAVLKRHLKNPESLQIHSTTSSKSGDEYTFIIDCSAMNSFGGYTRNTYVCVVDCVKGIVNLAVMN